MARIQTARDPLLLGEYAVKPSGALGRFRRGVRRSGALVVSRGAGRSGASHVGTVKPGVSCETLAAEWAAEAARRGVDVRLEVTLAGRALAGKPILSHVEARRRERARVRRDARSELARAAANARAVKASQALAENRAGRACLSASGLELAGCVDLVQWACGRSLGFCSACGRARSWDRGAILADRWVCDVCVTDPDTVDRSPSGVPYHGPTLAEALLARPDARAVRDAMKMLG